MALCPRPGLHRRRRTSRSRARAGASVSWQEAGERVEALANALLAHGVGRGDAVAVIARTRLEWVLLDWAIMSIGAVVVGIYPTSTATECAYILGHSESVLAFVEDDVAAREGRLGARRDAGGARALRLRRAWRARGGGPRPRSRAPDAHSTRRPARSWKRISRRSSTRRVRPARRRRACSRTENLVTAALRVRTNLEDGSDVVLLVPAARAHVGRLAHQAAAYYGSTVAFVAEATRVAEALGAVRPTILPAVPRIYEKIHAGVLEQIEREGGAKRVDRALGPRRRGSGEPRSRRAGRPVPPLLAAAGAARRPAGLREGQADGSAAGYASASPARRRSARCARVLPLARHARRSRATGSRRRRAR